MDTRTGIAAVIMVAATALAVLLLPASAIAATDEFRTDKQQRTIQQQEYQHVADGAWSELSPVAADPQARPEQPAAPPGSPLVRPDERSGQVLQVLPFGAGLACLGLGLGMVGLRLRRD